MTEKRIKLVAMDSEDLAILAAHCQDAVLKVRDIRFLPSESRFFVELNRFVWEQGAKRRERRRAVLHFEHVKGARAQGINQRDRDQVLSLLTLLFTEKEAPAGTIELVFSGDFQIRLDVECVEAQLTDLRASWEASSVPRHET
ncbi:MAG: DUF2948 family protein [Nitratireductor sp.]|nr:DUF2948 family protein [Nitratireductor sp.]